MRKHRTTMYRNGSSWTISRWDESVNCYRLTEGKTYWQARAICGEDNCRNPKTCNLPSHDHGFRAQAGAL
jgi:hypothetical protein